MKGLLCSMICCCVLLITHGTALNCHSGSHEANDEFNKYFKVCAKRFSTGNKDNSENEYKFNESSNFDSSSESQDHFSPRNDKFSPTNLNQKNYSERYNNNNNNNRNNGNTNRFNRTNTNSWDSQSRTKSNDYYPSNSRLSNRDNAFNTGNSENDNVVRDKGCVLQCVFDELNIVDRKGFPQKESMLRFFVQNERDPETRDFIEESITECFQYLGKNLQNDKCYFSLKLVECLDKKFEAKCEDAK